MIDPVIDPVMCTDVFILDLLSVNSNDPVIDFVIDPAMNPVI